MTFASALAWLMVGVQSLASVSYYCQGDWRRGTYWVAAAVLTTSVTI